jgi:hypothetical protein
MPPAVAGLMRPPVLCLGRSSSELRFASQSHKSCRTTPPAWSARCNTCQSRSASLDIRCLPCLLIWHSKALIARTVLSSFVENATTGGSSTSPVREGCRPRCQPGASTPWGMGQIGSRLDIGMCHASIRRHSDNCYGRVRKWLRSAIRSALRPCRCPPRRRITA